jgi:NitT/TauT family transport system ATP-binding protein
MEIRPEVVIEARAITKSFSQPDGGKIEVIAATNLRVDSGTITALLGPSGSGKSTLLRMLCGLSQPSSGQVLWHGKPIAESKPKVSLVFQAFALFPWLTVLGNVEAPLEALGMGEIDRRKRALKALDMVGLDGFETAYPKELSGGMRQRVGFARALVVEPEVLFMDEPFSALDVLTAENLRNELIELWRNKRMPTNTIFIVTHNIEEAVLMADRVIILGRNPGHIRADFLVGMVHPHDYKAPRFKQLVDYIYNVLTQPDRHITPPGSFGVAMVVKARQSYQMLPHARPGGIAGFLELLADRAGHEDLYRLSDELSMEIDDLLPIVDSAVMLGYAAVREGDVELTPDGRAFAEAEMLTRKVLFREAALKNITLLRFIDTTLKSKSDHTIPDEFFHDILDEHFSEKETVRQMETALNWGRYAEIFDYDSDTGRLHQAETTEHTGEPNPHA